MDKIKINFLHICENAFFSQDKKLNIIGIFDQINVEGLPALHPKFSIAINVSGTVYDKKKVLEIISPSNKAIISPEMESEKLENKPKANMVINIVGLQFDEEGNYKIILKINDIIVSPEREDFFAVKKLS